MLYISPKTRQRSNKENRKSLTLKDFRFLFSDSVGIRTQDPQLRRLLLYPTELPNRSLCFLAEKFALCPKEGAKIVIIFGYAKLIGTPC